MLRRLHIERFALIDQLDLEVQPGFTVVTGETGAGKSIFLGALQLALGGRAEFASVGQPGFKCVVEAEFSVSEARKEEWTSDDWDWWSSDGTASLVLRREIHPGGRSRAFINDSPVRLDELKRVSSALVDIHSQRDEGLWARSEGIVLLLENFAPVRRNALGSATVRPGLNLSRGSMSSVRSRRSLVRCKTPNTCSLWFRNSKPSTSSRAKRFGCASGSRPLAT